MTRNEVQTLIAGLERRTWPIERWHHPEHLAMAVWYLTYLPRRQALDVIRRRIQIYNAAHGIPQTRNSGYHESVTLFMAEGVGAFLDALPEHVDLEGRLQLVLEAFRDLGSAVHHYYAPSTVASWTARTRWVAPDRRPIGEWLRRCAELARA